MKKIIFSGIFLFLTNTAFPQLSITTENTNFTIDFDNTFSGVNSGTYNGTGFSANPSEGQLNSNAWAATGMSDGDFSFGGEATTGDFAQGIEDGGVGTGGFYTFQVESDNNAFGIQPNLSDWTPGTVTLKVQNSTGYNITDLDISYDVYIFNDQNKSNSFNFSYSEDNLNYSDVPSISLTSPEEANTSPTWSQNHKSTEITGLNIISGNYFYLRWSGDEVSGSNSMDEFALDNINVNATTGALSPTLVSFLSAGITVNEDAGTYDLIVQIQNPSSTPTSADVELTTGDEADIDNYSTQAVTFPANSSANQSISLKITDDILKEGNETLTFTLQNFSGGNSAQGGAIVSFDLTIIDNDIPKIVINEILADPPDGIAGDANGDGTRDGSEDEFIEIVNASGSEVNISGWQLFEETTLRHTFPSNTIIPDMQSIVVFSGGSPNNNIPGVVQKATSGSLVLTNSGDQVLLKDDEDFLVDSYEYGSEGNNNESLARNPDITGDFVGHTSITTNPVMFSPGRKNTDNSALPVELTSFTANIFDNNIELNWQTATEINNFGFNIQRKTKYSGWQKIGFVHGFGTTNIHHNYFYTDKNLKPGIYSYHLKQIDTDGKSEYSKTLTVKLKNNLTFELKQNYPNPFNPVTKITYSIPQKSYVSLKVFNILGEVVANLVHEKELPGKYSVVLSTEDYTDLTSGIYFYSLHYKNFIETKKMIVLK